MLLVMGWGVLEALSAWARRERRTARRATSLSFMAVLRSVLVKEGSLVVGLLVGECGGV